jgi:hypothetical protein
MLRHGEEQDKASPLKYRYPKMKRPGALYLVAGWCCLGLLVKATSLVRPSQPHPKKGSVALKDN